MNALAVSMIVGAIVMLLLALWMFKHSKETRFRERMMHNFREAIPLGATVSGTLPGTPLLLGSCSRFVLLFMLVLSYKRNMQYPSRWPLLPQVWLVGLPMGF